MLLRIIFALALFTPVISQAKEIAGVNYPDSITLPNYQKSLVLNGAGIRYKIFFKIYTAALYVETPSNNSDDIINQTGAKRLHLVILHDEVSREKMVNATVDGFEDNLTEKERTELATEIAAFYEHFETVREGDELMFDYVPNQGTHFIFNGKEKGIIPSYKFNQALLKIWIGEYPATESLKRGLLNQD